MVHKDTLQYAFQSIDMHVLKPGTAFHQIANSLIGNDFSL